MNKTLMFISGLQQKNNDKIYQCKLLDKNIITYCIIRVKFSLSLSLAYKLRYLFNQNQYFWMKLWNVSTQIYIHLIQFILLLDKVFLFFFAKNLLV